jgi:transcriptional regulator with PAS, ATPase and Fis domain
MNIMDSLLSRIQPTVIKYADVIAQIIKVDVEIMDNNFKRIASTGEYENLVNSSMVNDGRVYKTVIETKSLHIVKNPGEDEFCIECPKSSNCLEKCEICTPIILNDEVIGVIGLICFKDEQKDYLMANLDTFINFIQQISEFISAKAYEVKESEQILKRISLLNKVVDKLEQGVIVLDKNNCISQINKCAYKMLGIENYSGKKVKFRPTENYYLDHMEYEFEIDNKQYFLNGNLIKADLSEEKYDTLFIFDETKNLTNWINKLTNIEDDINLNSILSVSDKMINLKKRVVQISKSTSTVFITGESGTGKEMFARAIHKISDRGNYPFIAINCGAIPEPLIESELFGYVKGAFTGADPKGRIGKFQLANRGTIFLDEIGDLPLYMQVKLLRAIQEREITRVGSNQTINIDVRIIAATNKNIEHMIKSGQFRDDLYYRLNVIPLEIPPLRERIEDIKILTINFANKYSQLFTKKFEHVDKEVWKYFYEYPWPGNIRELENTVEFLVNIMSEDGIITQSMLPKKVKYNNESKSKDKEDDGEAFNLKEIEKRIILRALKKYGISTEGKKSAAHRLGIGIATLYRKIKEMGLEEIINV